MSRLGANVQATIEFYNSQVDKFERSSTADKSATVQDIVSYDSSKISWSSSLLPKIKRGESLAYTPERQRVAHYRPFCKQNLYFDRDLNHRVGQLPKIFPTAEHANIGFYLLGAGAMKPFSSFMVDSIPDLNFYGSEGGQLFPRWTYERAESLDGGLDFASADAGDFDEYGYRRVDNITGGILTLYRDAIGNQVTKDDIFYYVYGLLHDPAYREKYAADLKKMLPHIPTPETRERFEQLATAGRDLAELHVGYETVGSYPLDVRLKPGADPSGRETWRVQKMKWRSKTDHTAIVYNSHVTIAGIPEDAERYLLGSRSALAWIIDRYQVKIDKASGIVNDPNDWCDEHDDPAYVVDLIKKVTTVSVETMRIVDQLSAEAPVKVSNVAVNA